MYVYRVENQYKHGPYFMFPCTWMTTLHAPSNNHPGPWNDNIRGGWNDNHIFGFKDLKQLQAWFWPEELRKLQKLGFIPKRVKAKNIVHGDHQVAFIRA